MKELVTNWNLVFRANSNLYSKPIMRFTADNIRNDLGVEVYNDNIEDTKAIVNRFENDII